MRKFGFFVLAAASVMFFLAGCQQATTPVAMSWTSGTCATCHATGTYAQPMLNAKATYEASGHLNGPRPLTTAGTYLASGSNFRSDNNDPSGCTRCHTSEGFVSWAANPVDIQTVSTANGVTTYTASGNPAVGDPSPIGCFTCHDPHVRSDFSLRYASAVKLSDAVTKYDMGAGNLCAACHVARTYVGQVNFTPATGATTVAASGHGFSTHHNPQADFVLGADAYPYTGATYTKSAHYTADSCVTCHMFNPSAADLVAAVTNGAQYNGDPSLGGHGTYLTSNNGDYVGTCFQCHKNDGSGVGKNWLTSGTPAQYDGTNGMTFLTGDQHHDANGTAILVQIQTEANTLVKYFQAKGFLTWTNGGTLNADGYYKYHRDFTEKGSATATPAQAKAYWNLVYFFEDKSYGIHNPTFAADMLFDSITDLNTNAAAALAVPAKRP
ncbi:MAG: hypothetical protein M0001_15295 [Treponema sp.]|nr:hypothetical protein [Treponema sp.]